MSHRHGHHPRHESSGLPSSGRELPDSELAEQPVRQPHPLSENRAEAEASHGYPAEHRPGLQPEKYFRWRSGEITRLEAFCDVVFGFALTLLVVSLEVPRSYGELMTAARGFLPFAVCFAILAMIWRAHYRFSRRYGLEDSYTVLLNMVLLFLVLFYVYPLKFVFTVLFSQFTGSDMGRGIGMQEGASLMRLYAAGFTAVFAIFALMHAHAYKLRTQLQLNALEILETKLEIQQTAIMIAVGAVSFMLAFKSPAWAGWWFFVLGPALGIHGTIYGKRVRKLSGSTPG